MPHRLVSLAILIAWARAATALFTRDVLPDLILGPPPDLGSVTRPGIVHETTRWTLQVEERLAPGTYRSVGQVETTFDRKRDGDVQMTSDAEFDTEGLLRALP